MEAVFTSGHHVFIKREKSIIHLLSSRRTSSKNERGSCLLLQETIHIFVIFFTEASRTHTSQGVVFRSFKALFCTLGLTFLCGECCLSASYQKLIIYNY